MTEADGHHVEVAEHHGCSAGLARVIIKWAREYELPISLGFAVVEQESNFRKVFGHDRGQPFEGAGEVTKEKYQRYKRQRGPRGEGGQQGVGETQLTHYSFQDEADKLGGCWTADANVQVAFRLLSRLINKHGEDKGLAAYNAGEGGWRNGQGYAREVQAKQRRWHQRLA
jgi:hypothetical protein